MRIWYVIFIALVAQQTADASSTDRIPQFEKRTLEIEALPILKAYEDKGFSPHDWASAADDHGYGFNRTDQFYRLLESYDLIEMPRSKIVSLLGAEDVGSCYSLIGGTICGNAWSGLGFEYENDKVSGWRLEHNSPGARLAWTTLNVVWRDDKFVPKEGAVPTDRCICRYSTVLLRREGFPKKAFP
jgi:hypothetical protein